MSYYNESYEYGDIRNVPDNESKRDIFIDDESTWDIYYDLSGVMDSRIPRNEQERDDFLFMKGIIIYLKQDGHISQKQLDRLKNIYRKYHNV